jgi:hypothetical protein
MPTYTRTLIKARVAPLLTGTVPDTTINALMNKAVTDVLDEADLRSTKRKTALTPFLITDVYQYTCPTDMKGMKIIDLKPQVGRSRFDDWRLTTEEEFDRLKETNHIDAFGDLIEIGDKIWKGENLVAFSDASFVRKLLISRPVDDKGISIDPIDSATGWTAVGDAENIEADTSNYVSGSGSVKFDISSAGGTTCGITKAISSFDITDYKSEGMFLVWAYITSVTNLTNFILKVGSDSSNYYSVTVTTTSEGASFAAGWNLLRFAMSGKTTTGTPDDDACDYVSLYMTKAGAKISEVGYRFDNLILRLGVYFDIIYYSKYLWQSSAGSYLENSTADTDYLNVDADELKLVENKYLELAETYLGSGKEDRWFKYYQSALANHQSRYPSEALVLSTEYYNVYMP